MPLTRNQIFVIAAVIFLAVILYNQLTHPSVVFHPGVHVNFISGNGGNGLFFGIGGNAGSLLNFAQETGSAATILIVVVVAVALALKICDH